MAEELAVPAAGQRALPGRREVIRYLIGLAAGALILVLLAGHRGELAEAWHQLRRVSAGWMLAAVAAEAVSLSGYAWLQRHVLRLSSASVPLPGLALLTLANEAIANTVPGEPVISSAYRFRYYQRRGVGGASAGWTIFTILIAQAIGMSLLLLLGVLIAVATSASGRAAGAAVAGLVIIVAAVAVLVRRDLVLRAAAALVRGVRRVTGRPRADLGERIETTLLRMREIPLGAGQSAGVVLIAAGVWFADFGCLACSFGAMDAAVPWHGVLLAYGVAQVVGSLPLIPGGLGLIEGSLAVILAAYGTSRVQALSVALAYRLVSFWLAITVGWVSVGVIALLSRRQRRLRSLT